MTRKIFGRIMSARLFVFAIASLAALALSAFDTPYLTFRSASSFSITAYTPNWDGTLEYSTDAVNWTTWTGGSSKSISGVLSDGQYRLYLRGTGNTVVSGGNSFSFSGSGDVYCEGDIETLRDYNGNPPAMAANCYKYMFMSWTKLKSAPALSATELATECYSSMFNGCTGLTTAPALPATTLTERCYYGMFSGCTGLTAAPTLQATTMATYCYGSMFNGCTSITESPALPATTLADNCYSSMFMGCTGLKTLPVLSATTTMSCSYYQMFKNCSCLVINSTGDPSVAWSIPSLVSAGSIYNYNMFQGTGGDFTSNPVAGTTYYVESALPPGLKQETSKLHAYTGASININLADTITGGTGEYTFTDAANALSALGLSLSGTTLSGTISTAGNKNFTLHVVDTTSPDPLALDPEYTLVVADPDPLSAQTDLGTVKVGKTMGFTLTDTISGGVPTYTFDFNGAHDAAFSLAAGVLTFTPTAAQNYSCAITVTDALGSTLPVTYTVAAVESAGFTDDDPDEPETGDVVNCLTPDGVFPRTCHQITSSSTAVTWTDSWYYVAPNATVTLSAGAIVSGKVSLILGDGATLTVQGASNKAGVNISADATLTIYGQGNGTGILNATGGGNGAGIGGNQYENGGTLNVYGGEIVANGGSGAAGIGRGAASSTTGKGGNSGNIAIFGGTVTATGGSAAAGIGGGKYGNCGILTINGGTVTAAGTGDGAGIGGGDFYGNGGTVTINGGTVTAVSNGSASGIGSGWNGVGGDVIINGGTVTATGGSSYAGIGAGNGYNQGTLTVGGNVVVKAGTSTPLTDANIQTPDGNSISLSTIRRYYFIEATGPAPLAQTTSAFSAYVDDPFEVTLSATVSGGTPTYTFVKKSGTLPDGLIFEAGVISGTPTAAASETVVFTVTDSGTGAESQNEDFTYTITVTAKPKAITYKNGEATLTGLTPSNYVEGVGATLPTSVIGATGYSFAGWYDNAGLTGDAVTTIGTGATGPQTFYASWTATVYTVTYMLNSTTPITDQGLAPTSYTIESETQNLPANATRAGYGFYGWYDNSGCTGSAVTTIPHGSTGNKIFYAQWGAVKSNESYVDASGNSMPAQLCTEIASDTTTLSTGWYVAKGDVTISESVTVSGDVNLILADGAHLEVTVASGYKSAINVASGNSLTIYAQANGTGRLDATGGGSISSGIGGNNGQVCGSVTINGGTVVATGGTGIGGGYNAAGGTVVINGGKVTATSSSGSGTGIGGGSSSVDQGTLDVGANVVVKAGSSSTLTDSDIKNPGGETSISLTTMYRYYYVEKQGPAPFVQTTNAFAAYANEVKNWNLADTITGGTPTYSFTPVAGFEPPTGLTLAGTTLSGSVAAADTYTFKYSVTDSSATPLNLVAVYTLTVTAPDPITAATNLNATVGRLKAFNITNTISGGLSPYSLVFSGTEPTGFSYRDGVLSGTATEANTYNFTITVTDSLGTVKVLNYTLVTAEAAGFIDDDPDEPEGGDTVTVDCRTADGKVRDRTCHPVASSSTAVTWNNSWYYVTGNVTLSAGVTVNGKVSLVLADGATLTVSQSTNNKAGINVTGENSLVIYAQSNGAGVGQLVATGADQAAGIGGDNRQSAGKVTVYGGDITANGGNFGAAGIGGGTSGNGGTVTIYGGTVTALGNAVGIGAGDSGNGGTVVIKGGTVTATSGSSVYPGIGAGYGKDQGTLRVGYNIVVKAGSGTPPTTELTHGASDETGYAIALQYNQRRYYAITTKEPDPLTQTTSTLVAFVNEATAINLTETVAGGTPDYTFALKTGTIPSGLELVGTTITGTPATKGPSTLVFTVADSADKNDEFTYTLLVADPPQPITYIDGHDGTTELTGLTPTNYIEGIGATLPATKSKLGYNLDGWYDNDGLVGDPVTAIGTEATGPKTFYAKWKTVAYRITYKDGSTTMNGLMPTNYTIESGATLPATATKDGYGFYGWYTNSSFLGSVITGLPVGTYGNKTFYAKWGDPKVPANYIDADGNPQRAEECLEISSTTKTLETGWYVVNASTTIDSTVTVAGDVKLILADGVTLTVNGTAYKAGINVTGDNSLTIYAQENGTGALTVTAGSDSAGIGGNRQQSCGTVIICGGNVTAKAHGASLEGAGIGGGSRGDGGTVTIYGGTVVAQTQYASSYGAGIGGGGGTSTAAGNGGTVTIYGGNVTATAVCKGAGIGGGYYGNGGTVTIYGGTVVATSAGSGAGIGGGMSGNGGNVTIEGGYVTATAGSKSDLASNVATGIGKGYGNPSTYTKGTLTVGENMVAYADSTENPTIKLGSGSITIGTQRYFVVRAADLSQTKGEFFLNVGEVCNIDLSKTVKGGGGNYTFTLKDGSSLPSQLSIVGGNVLTGTVAVADIYDFTLTVTDPMLLTPLYADYTMTVRPAGFIPDDPEEPVSGDTVDCRTADGEVRSRTCQQVESSDVAVVWSDSWYYVTNNVTLNAGVTVNGNVSLILCDGATLTVRGATANDPGIKLIRTDSATNTLVIYGLSVGDGAGALTAIGGTHAPGIGTSRENNDWLERFGCLIVNGGVVTASCNEGNGDYGAGIGTSYRQTGDGSLTVNGGSVTAIGGSEAAGIGGGPGGSVYVTRGGYGFDVTVNGGTVVAIGGEEGAGIGGGHYGNGGTLTVNGGTVTATGGYYAAGIGGGRGVGSGDGGHGGVVHIYGGTVTARTLYTGEGSDLPTGIGQGYAGCSHPGDLFVYDGVIVNAGSREDLTQKQLPDENHEIRILASHRYFYIETQEIVPRLVNIAPILDSVDKNDRYFSRLLANNINGGWGQLHFAMDDGAELPAGLELDDSGRLAGTPTQAGTFEIHVVVTDSSEPSNELQTTFTLKVNEIYSIMYYDSDGTTRVYPLPVINSYFEGTGVDELPVPTKTGYVFAGWYEDKVNMAGDSVISISAEATGDKTFYAKWTPVQYSITYIDASEPDGQHPEGQEIYGLEPSSYTIESGAILPTSANKEGYMLLGWYADKWFNGSSITAIPVGEHTNKTFYAKWFELGHPLELADGEIDVDAGEEIDLNLKDTITGGTVTYSFALKEEVGNALPAGLELDSDGTLSGSVASAGSYTFKVMVTDSTEPEANVIEAVYTLQVNFTKSTSDPQGLDGKFYIGIPSSINLASAISGGTAPYSFSLVPEEGSLPDGMAINGNKLEGTPTMVGNSHFCLRVTDDNGVVSDLYYWTYVQSNNINQYYSINGINWGWVHSAPPKSDGCLSIWGGGTNAIPAGTVGSVYVPSHIGNISDPITCIGSAAFSNCTAVTRVTLPETIIDIGVNAFAGCTSLTSLVIRANVAHINAGAFSGCSNLGVVYVDQGDADRVRALVAASGCDVSGIAFVESDFYTITLDTNLGSEFEMPVLTRPYVESDEYLPTVGNLPVPTRYNYTFDGWYTEKTGGTRVDEDQKLSGGDWTLYAHWTTELEDPVFTIDYKGELTDVTLNGHTEIVIPDTVTSIGDRALDGLRKSANKSLLRVVIPGTVKSIGTRAFAECIRLREINIPEGVTNISLSAFNYCGSLESVEIPGSVETIGNFAFANCSNIVSVTINNGVNSIGQSAFANCTSLSCDDEQGFYIPDSVESIGNGAFHGIAFTKASLPGSLYSDGSPVSAAFMNVNLLKSVDVTYRTDHPTFVIHSGRLTRVYLNGNTEVVVPDSVTEIWSGAFSGLSSMTSVTIPDTVTIIRVGAFTDCTGLTEIDLPDSLLYLEAAFGGCTNLKNIVIPDSVTEISEGCFSGCGFLESVTIGSSVTRIPFSAFAYCSNLTNVTIRGNLTSIARVAFSGCSSLPAIEFPNSLNVIDGSAFYNCASLASVRIPKGVEVGSFAFADCSSLKSANVGGTVVPRLMSAKSGMRLLAAPPEDATKLGSYAFSGCSELENATIGSTVDEIGGGAFGGCTKLKSITVESGNENYETVGAMLLSADGKVLISGAGDATNITVPNGVTNILEGAFAGFTSITNVTLPNTVRIVGEAAFSNSTALATIRIPSSVTAIGANAFCGTALAKVYVSANDKTRVQGLVSGTGYDISDVAFYEPGEDCPKPSIDGDDGATVTGNAETGYTVVPSSSATESTVEVTIPDGLDAEKVTVEVPPTASVKPNGANVKVVKTVSETPYDITAYLDLPAAVEGVINLNNATVKEAIVKEVLDPEKTGVVIDLTPSDPTITTAATRPGLTYTFYEGTTLEGMTLKTTKVGDGESWTPTITVKGGTSGFYSVHVTK